MEVDLQDRARKVADFISCWWKLYSVLIDCVII